MEKKYDLSQTSEVNIVSEPMAQYYKGKKLSPPLTEEELQNALTTEEVQARIFKHIDKLFGE